MIYKFIIPVIPSANSLQPDYPKTKLIKFIFKSVSFCKAPRLFQNGGISYTASLDAMSSVWVSLRVRVSNLTNLDNADSKEENLVE